MKIKLQFVVQLSNLPASTSIVYHSQYWSSRFSSVYPTSIIKKFGKVQAHKVWWTLMLCGCLAHTCAGFGDLVAQVVRLDALWKQFERFGDLGSQF